MMTLTDTEIDEAEYDAFHGAMTVQNYESVFIPNKQARLARLQQAQLDHVQEMDDLIIPLGGTQPLTDEQQRTLEGDDYKRHREWLEARTPGL